MSPRTEVPESSGRSQAGKIAIVAALGGLVGLVVVAPRGSADADDEKPARAVTAPGAEQRGVDGGGFPLRREPLPAAGSDADDRPGDLAGSDGGPIL